MTPRADVIGSLLRPQYLLAAREQLIREGRTIIANNGDQVADLTGGAAERTFKPPNVFYLLP
jgi:hypothetical protein